MKTVKHLFILSIIIFSTSCKKDCPTPFGEGGCFQRDLIEDFNITSIEERIINPLIGRDTLDCRPILNQGGPCRIDVGGNSDGIRSQRCKFIYVFVKATTSNGWFRQEVTTSLMNGGNWSTNVQLGDEHQNLPFGHTFEIVAVVTGEDLSEDPNPISNLETELPIDHKKTDFVRVYIMP